MASSSPAPAIGIDLGTTFSCVGVLVNEKVHIISNEQGKTTTPSYVAFTDNGRIVGERAKQWWAVVDPENTVNNVKRLIGRTVQEEVVKKDIEKYPFKVIDGGEGKPKVQVKYEGRDRLFSPEDISAVVLGELKALAEEFLKKPVTEAVITVPAYFTDAQRQATIDAGTIAGLKVLGTINEPTAAALAYGFEQKEIGQETTVLVYDFGGGTFDVSVLSICNGKIEVRSTAGDGHLGGEDIDDVLVQHFAEEFLKKYEIDLFERARQHGTISRDAKRALRRLRNNCEKAKIALSTETKTRIELDELFESKDLDAVVTRAFFEEKCDDLIRKTMQCLMSTVQIANMAQEDISEIILVGGSTKIPKVMNMLHEVFPRTKFCESINPDEAVAFGAAIQAAILSKVDSEVLKNVHLRDVTPMSLGMETFGGVMATLIPRNSPIPTSRSKKFSTSKDYQTEICFQVFEGERIMTKYNNMLGEFTLVGIPPAPRGIPLIEVTFTIDKNGILKVTAFDVGSECESSIEITNNRGRLTQEEIEKAVEEAKRMREKDQKEKKKVEARDKLETQARRIEKALTNPRLKEKIDPEQLRKVLETVDESLRLYESFQDPGEADFEEKRNQLDKLWLPIVSKLWPDRRQGGNRDAPILHDERSDYSVLE